jgi:transposase
MTKLKRGRYTLEFKQEAVRLVELGQSAASVARTLGVVEQTLGNWLKAHRAGILQGSPGKSQVSGEQMEISRLQLTVSSVSENRGNS